LILTPNYTFEKFKETFKESTLNHWFFEEISQSFEFSSNTQNLKFLWSEVLIKTQYTGCLNLKILKIQEPPNGGLKGKERCSLSWLNIETTFASCRLV
jgi:hypothetical protein